MAFYNPSVAEFSYLDRCKSDFLEAVHAVDFAKPELLSDFMNLKRAKESFECAEIMFSKSDTPNNALMVRSAAEVLCDVVLAGDKDKLVYYFNSYIAAHESI